MTSVGCARVKALAMAGVLVAMPCVSCGEGPAAPPTEPRSLPRIGDIRAMEPEERVARGEFTLRGVVTWHSGPARRHTLVLDDGTGGIFVTLHQLAKAEDAPMTPSPVGTLLEVRGAIGQALKEPRFIATGFREFGAAALPSPRHVDSISGADLYQRVRVQGVVQHVERADASHATLDLATKWGALRAVARVAPGAEPHRWVNGRIRFSGTVMGQVNPLHQIIAYHIVSAIPEDIEILERGDDDPFHATPLRLSDIRSLMGADIPLRRRVIHGTVTYVDPTVAYLQDAALGIRIEMASPPDIHVGDLAKASGFLAADEGSWSMTHAVAQSVGPAPKIDPRQIDPGEVFSSAGYRGLNPDVAAFGGTLVRLRAKFLETQAAAGGVRLLLEFGPEFLVATLPIAAGAPVIGPRRGAEVEVTGVLRLDHETRSRGVRGNIVPSGASLLLRDPSDVRVIRQGPWWNRQRLWGALLIAISFTALSATWGTHLWRSARRQALALAETQHAQRTLDIQQETTLRERDRLAGDLHDGIQQLLTGLCFHLEAAESQSGDPRPHIVNARSIVARIREEFRRCLWELGHVGRGHVDPAHSLQRIAALQHLCSDTHVDVTVEGTPGPVPSSVMASLSLVAREAIHNATRHGAAKRVAIALRGNADGLVLDISDDGCGFDPKAQEAMPDSHHGLRNMRQRVVALGGTLAIDSQPGHGTRLAAHIPAAALATDGARNGHPENLPGT